MRPLARFTPLWPKRALVGALATLCAWAPSGMAVAQSEEDEEIGAVISRLAIAWAAGNAEAWGAEFTEDADFTVWFGLALKGREKIESGHSLIFDGFYENTLNRIRLRGIRFLAPSVALVHLEGSVIRRGEGLPEEPHIVSLAVVTRADGEWKIAAVQNTPYAVTEFRARGDVRRLRELTAAQE